MTVSYAMNQLFTFYSLFLSKQGDIATFELLSQAFHHGVITGMDVCIRKPLIATCGLDRSVRIWNYEAWWVYQEKQIGKKNAAELVSNTYHNPPPVQNWRQEHLADDPMTPWFRHVCLFNCNHTTAELESRSNITLLLSVLRVMLNTTQSTCLFLLMIFF